MNAPHFFAHTDQPQGVTPEELERHIQSCRDLMEAAYARFQAHGDPNERDAALQHMHRMNQAILARPAAVQAARHAAFERRLDEGVDFFQAQGARYSAALGGRHA